MSSQDLVTLAAVKSWLGLPSSASPNDATLSVLITSASRTIYAALSRPALLPQIYTEAIDAESRRVFLRHWPVLQINSVLLDGLSVPEASATGVGTTFGYCLKPGDVAPPGAPQALDLFGKRVRRERQNLIVNYSAGYAVQGENQTAPGAAPWALEAFAPFGPWAGDLGVVYSASGKALTPVAGSPTPGQYCITSGVYTFSSGDAGAPLTISYGFIPQDLAQAALELAAERFRASDRIGLRSKSLGGQETISYDTSAMPASIQAQLQPYRRVAV
jgi:hypothetical protein